MIYHEKTIIEIHTKGHSTKSLTSTPQNYPGLKKQKSSKRTDKRKLKNEAIKYDNLDGTLEYQKGNTSQDNLNVV